MDKIISTAIFNTNGEFLEWQRQSNRDIISVQILPNAWTGTEENKIGGRELNATYLHKIFVQFWIDRQNNS